MTIILSRLVLRIPRAATIFRGPGERFTISEKDNHHISSALVAGFLNAGYSCYVLKRLRNEAGS